MKKALVFAACLSIFLFTSCKKDENNVTDPLPEVNEEELITTLLANVYPLSTEGDTLTFAFRDLDGPGGNDPEPMDTITLQANSTYGCFLTLLNESITPVDDITVEIENEADEHLFCFDIADAALTIVRTDTDGMYEVGLQSAWTTAASSSGSMHLVLKHQPGIKNGSCEPGDTDIELTFPVVIQ